MVLELRIKEAASIIKNSIRVIDLELPEMEAMRSRLFFQRLKIGGLNMWLKESGVRLPIFLLTQ